MISRHIQALAIEDASAEEPAATRERLRDAFPRGATRRMTQLGLLIGGVLEAVKPAEDPIVYASSFAESRALEDYLASFPSPSPTLFQTSIHPSAVQQALIARQQPLREFFPLTGFSQLVLHAVETAFLAAGTRAVLCGGEERGTWLTEMKAASERSFAFAIALSANAENSLGTVAIEDCDESEGRLTLGDFFDALRDRRPLRLAAAPGRTLHLEWK